MKIGYFKDFPGAKHIREKLVKCESADEALEILNEYKRDGSKVIQYQAELMAEIENYKKKKNAEKNKMENNHQSALTTVEM